MLSIRPATKADVLLVLAFIRDLAEYEREPHKAVATSEDLIRDGFTPGAAPRFSYGDCRMGWPGSRICALLLQLFDMERAIGNLPGTSVCAPGVSRKHNRHSSVVASITL